LVTLRAPQETVAGELLSEALSAGRPYQVSVPLSLASAVRDQLTLRRSVVHRIYCLDPSRFQHIVNVLVQLGAGADGTTRCQIESQGQLVAIAGTNWRSPNFAEVYVYVHPRGRGRGWGKSVVSACTSSLLEEGLRPLYMVEESNEASIHIAESIGYVDTGLSEYTAEGTLK
jgi:predicted GNAT family acetyltransferase